MNIFVGNLSFETTEAELKQLFETIGEVSSAVIVMEKEKKAPKSRGFGFVEMPVEAQALAAISALNGKDFMGRPLNVNPTKPRTETKRAFISRPGTYKGGRRTRSYAMRTGAVDMDKGTKPWQKKQENPMRWRSRRDQPKPWIKKRSAKIIVDKGQ